MSDMDVPEVFQPLWNTPSRYKAIWGGRGSGKSYNFANMLIMRASQESGLRWLCVREVQKSLKESAHRLLADTIDRNGLGAIFEVQSTQIKTPGNGIINFIGMQDHTAASVKSLENYSGAWIEEAQTLSHRSLELLRPTIRAPGSEIWASWNPRSAGDAIDQLLRGIEQPDDALIIKANYSDNPFFPAELEQERLYDYKYNPDRYAHIWLGMFEPQAAGAIFTRQVLHDNRRTEMGVDRERTLVAVDPAVTETDSSNETGITVQALGSDNRGYLLEDGSLYGSPHAWATRAVALYDKWNADGVVIEKNQGGDMCRHTLQTIRKALPIIEVTATRGKHVRAEPISAAYNLNMISHVGTFPELEDQLCLFTSHGWDGDATLSPDRAEAAIWGFTELMPQLLRDVNRKASTEENPEEMYFNYATGGGSAWMA